MRLSPQKPHRSVEATVEEKPDGKPADGSFQAMDQIANWVRFADAKATILTAGFGVVVSMLMTNAKTVAAAFKIGCPQSYVIGTMTVLALIAAGYTLYWLMRAICPRSIVSHSGLNRFAWPTLSSTTLEALMSHTGAANVRVDAWRQVIDLSVVADLKFAACKRAIRGFVALVVLGVACVTTAVALTS